MVISPGDWRVRVEPQIDPERQPADNASGGG